MSSSGRGPRLPWESPGVAGSFRIGGVPAARLPEIVRFSLREARGVLDRVEADGPSGAAGRDAPGLDTAGLDTADRGPDRVSRMPGGAEVLVRQRRARRTELLKEAFNVGAGMLGVFLAGGLALLTWGLGIEVAAAAAAATALGYGYVLGREVVADLAGVRERERRDARRG